VLLLPSIFNDVIGPVMRGPSSSHCAAALRLGRLTRDFMDGDIAAVRVEFDRYGSLAETHTSHGSDMGLLAGLLGWEVTDERMLTASTALVAAGIRVEFEITDLPHTHPNTYRLTLRNTREEHVVTAISTGGGMIEIIDIDGIAVVIAGDCFETLIMTTASATTAVPNLDQLPGVHRVQVLGADQTLIEIKGSRFVAADELVPYPGLRVQSIKHLRPVLPVLTGKSVSVPFSTCAEMLAFNAGRHFDLSELAILYECARGDVSADEVQMRMREIARILSDSVAQGLAGTDHSDRILPAQAPQFATHLAEGRLLDAGMLNTITLYVTALMEVKSAMGLIVAAPTAGSCGAVAGCCLGAAKTLALGDDQTAGALLAAGMVGVFIAARASFAAETAGCQVECGAGSAMAAAALVTLAGGGAAQAVDAASLALQNVIGLVCDPVANRVEVPCLGRNIMAAANAVTCANLALAGFDAVVPLDEVIDAVAAVGAALPRELRCTALGGLSLTPSAQRLTQRLAECRGTTCCS